MMIGEETALGTDRGGDHDHRRSNNIHRIDNSNSSIQLKMRSLEQEDLKLY
jgi:hypothetical protein